MHKNWVFSPGNITVWTHLLTYGCTKQEGISGMHLSIFLRWRPSLIHLHRVRGVICAGILCIGIGLLCVTFWRIHIHVFTRWIWGGFSLSGGLFLCRFILWWFFLGFRLRFLGDRVTSANQTLPEKRNNSIWMRMKNLKLFLMGENQNVWQNTK